MRIKKILVGILAFVFLFSTVSEAFDLYSRRQSKIIGVGYINSGLRRLTLVEEREGVKPVTKRFKSVSIFSGLPLKGPGGGEADVQPQNTTENNFQTEVVTIEPQKGIESTVKAIPKETTQAKRWEFTNPDGTPLSTIFLKNQNGEWHYERVVQYANGDTNLFRTQIYYKRLPNGSYNYDRVVRYKTDGITINFVHQYKYDSKTSRRKYMTNYKGPLNNNYITSITQYGHTDSGKRHRAKVTYYKNGNKNQINFTDYYDSNDKYLYRIKY